MVDTVRSLAALQALLADNTSADISPQDIRDFLVSVFSQISDADGDTKVQVEEAADEDVVRVDTDGTERVTIDGTDMLVKTVPIKFMSIGEPATPSAGDIRLFSYVSAGRVLLASKGPDGVVCNICDFANVAAPHTNTLALNWVQD